jgi:protein-S-isoprenylcysteine O-methyltransferase Ste14
MGNVIVGDVGGNRLKLTEFMVRRRTKISQMLGVVFLLVFIFSEKKLEGEAPFLAGIMFTTGCVLVGLATVGRLWCAQYIAGYKTDALVTEGPYSICRNPLYFFSFLGGTGAGLCTESASLAVVIIVAFVLIYPVTIRAEERKLRGIFGDAYEKYSAEVPRFIPNPSLFHEPSRYVIATKAYRREIVDALFFIWAVGLFELGEMLIELRILPVLISIY